MDEQTQRLLDHISTKLHRALKGYVFEQPSAEMMRIRFVATLGKVIGEQVTRVVHEHLKVSTIQDEIILEIGEPLQELIEAVYGSSLLEALCVDHMIRLPGWERPGGICAKIEEPAQIVELRRKAPKPFKKPETTKPEPTTRPRSRQLWQGD